jgi:hypothetical protein
MDAPITAPRAKGEGKDTIRVVVAEVWFNSFADDTKLSSINFCTSRTLLAKF